MYILNDNFHSNFNSKTYIALGSFDGLHMGHIHLLNYCKELSKKNNISSMVYTFENHPLSIINADMMPKLIMSNPIKVKILENMGIDILNMVKFDKDFMAISPEDFIKQLVYHYKPKGLIVGFNYRFGYKNLGDIELLLKLKSIYKFEVHEIKPIRYQGEIVSSSRIRHLISEGEIETADALLTRPYMLSGKVIKGKQNGRTMGFPTINLDYDKSFVIPKGGVYYSNVIYKNQFYKGITNVGYNPTFKGDKLSIETHILDFNQDIYGDNVDVLFISKMRDEKKFSSIDELKSRLNLDKKYASYQELKKTIYK